jgi:hypothetical protein
MAITHSTAVRTALATAVRSAIDGGGGAGKIEIYTAARATLLGTCTCAATSGTLASGVLTFGAIAQDTSADATGTAALFDVKDFAGATIFSGTITATGGGGDMTMPSVSITAAEPIQVTSLTYSAPA